MNREAHQQSNHKNFAQKKMLQLYLVMGSVNCGQADPKEVLRAAIEGGVTCFQFREKGLGALTGIEKITLGRELQQICAVHQIPFIVNDDLQLALELGADGLHIGQEDGPMRMARESLGSDKLLGISAHTVEEALLAVQSGADYLGVGPMYHTTTKADIREVRGPSILQEIRCALPDMPIVGIGGIAAGKARLIMESGADGIAVISAISKAKDPQLAAKKLREEIS